MSLGGATALRVGLVYPEAFGAVGALQPAVVEDQVAELTELARAARAKRPAFKLRLLTSKEDYFNAAISHTRKHGRPAGVGHDFVDVPGPHDYPFNRGPGAIEMLAVARPRAWPRLAARPQYRWSLATNSRARLQRGV